MVFASFVSLIMTFFYLAIIVAVPVLMGVYVYRDTVQRGMNAVSWTLIAALVPVFIGFIIYLVVRKNYSDLKCPNCNFALEADWSVCPSCTAPLPDDLGNFTLPTKGDIALKTILVPVIIIPIILVLISVLSKEGLLP